MGLKFDNKTVVITGSGTGIGQAIAKRFAEEGANIIIMGRRKEPLEESKLLLEDIIKRVNSKGRVRVFAGVDVSDENGISDMFDKIKEEFGGVDIVVNNAGVSGPVKVLVSQPFNEFKQCVAIHLTGTFRTSIHALRCMKENGKIITISTYFTEERAYEQRPYRFRTPYTAAQGAKNRLVEALAWELADKGIRCIATNPGPVHSDRIYKTVYPKAAAEFLRIGGFPGLKPKEIEDIANEVLPYLGDDESIVNEAINKLAIKISNKRGTSNVEELSNIIRSALNKMQEIAEKIQYNTSKMIVDGQFLTQEETADIVLTLTDDKISRLVNGRIMPADRVFYPVRPLIASSITSNERDLNNKLIVLTITSNNTNDIEYAKRLIFKLKDNNARCIILLSQDNKPDVLEEFKDIHGHIIDFNEHMIRRMFNIIRNNFGIPYGVIHIIGSYDYSKNITSLTREEWDTLVDKYINIPALITKEAINCIVPNGEEDPNDYKGSNGTIIIIGPEAPKGKKIHGSVRVRAEIFRGALRPFTATVNQELKEVLNSNIRVYTLLPGDIEGNGTNEERLIDSTLKLLGSINPEVIYYPDEGRI
jgi:NAD(P)-dependent dehydrogenase (short-subunit alcohol dehydrogenase family)